MYNEPKGKGDLLTERNMRAITIIKFNIYLQGRVQFPTGGKAREPEGMIRCNSEADSKVWMEED